MGLGVVGPDGEIRDPVKITKTTVRHDPDPSRLGLVLKGFEAGPSESLKNLVRPNIGEKLIKLMYLKKRFLKEGGFIEDIYTKYHESEGWIFLTDEKLEQIIGDYDSNSHENDLEYFVAIYVEYWRRHG